MPKWEWPETKEDRREDAEERRAEYIEDFAPAIAEKLLASEDFAWGVLVDLGDAAIRSVLQDVGRFFERYHALQNDNTEGAMVIARDLYLNLMPNLEAAADEQAREQVAADYDRSDDA